MKALKLTLAAAATLAFGTSAQAAPINLDSLAFGVPTPVFLDAGTYQINPIGTADGGTFDAYNAWGTSTGCDINGENCTTGWLWEFSMGSPSLGAIYPGPGPNVGDATARYETAIQALAAAQSSLINSTFTLTVSEVVEFVIWDSFYSDNVGGVSFTLSLVEDNVPAPGALGLLGVGLLLAGFRRRV